MANENNHDSPFTNRFFDESINWITFATGVSSFSCRSSYSSWKKNLLLEIMISSIDWKPRKKTVGQRCRLMKKKSIEGLFADFSRFFYDPQSNREEEKKKRKKQQIDPFSLFSTLTLSYRNRMQKPMWLVVVQSIYLSSIDDRNSIGLLDRSCCKIHFRINSHENYPMTDTIFLWFRIKKPIFASHLNELLKTMKMSPIYIDYGMSS